METTVLRIRFLFAVIRMSKVIDLNPSKLKSITVLCIFLGIVILGFNLKHIKLSNNDFLVRSWLFLPKKEFLLDRFQLLQQIENNFQKQKTKIQTVVLAGMQGSGKTTVARLYGRQQQFTVIWEINAETKDSLISGFNDLAFALAITMEQKQELALIQIIQNSAKKEKAIVNFVKRLLQDLPNWLLIYDNVENFIEVKDYLPKDPKTWGNGRVIITICDPNSTKTSYIKEEQVLVLGELNSHEILELFCKILYETPLMQLPSDTREKASNFLNHLPAFPLDITTAAYYIKNTYMTYQEYLQAIDNITNDFEMAQEALVKEVSNYSKSRYGILTLSFKKLINSNPAFKELLFFTCLLDSQNIPKNLFEYYKNKDLFDEFMQELKKYSLVTNESIGEISTFSIHRSTQAIGLAFFARQLNLKKNEQHFFPIANALKEYIAVILEKEDFPIISLLARHCEVFWSHNDLLTSCIKNIIEARLGSIYFCLGYYTKAKQLLGESLENLKRDNSKDQCEFAYILKYLGNTHRELGEFKKAKDLLEQSLLIHKKYFPENNIEIARILGHLGIIYRELYNYEKAQDLLEQSLIIYKNYFPHNHVDIARSLMYLGYVYRSIGKYDAAKNLFEQNLIIYDTYLTKNYMGKALALTSLGNIHKELGNYEIAKNLVEQALAIYEKYLGKNHVKSAWALVGLGNIHKELGNYEIAKNLVEQALIVYKKNFSINHARTAWALAHLGNIYINIGDYTKAKSLLQQSLTTFSSHYSEDHLEIGKILSSLGKACMMQGKLDSAENFTQQALELFQYNKHPDRYICLENLAEISLRKIKQGKKQKNCPKLQEAKKQAIYYLKQSLEILKNHFPSNSPHIVRVNSKLNEYQQY